ncbi:MAG TPA: MBL fold metallo-hydrolase, partial [Thermoleophilaceae bacterium]|nr:MBL fold metallo-hydrolase [Thermoleophilaceae bacterium]
MRAVSAHPDVLVITSRMWQTNAVAMRAGEEAMLIDSPYFPDELEALPGLLARAGFEPDALIATHADYDHVLGRVAFPGLALGVGEPSALRLREEPG